MTQNKNNHNEDQDRLKFENELKKLKLSLEKGATFSDPSNKEDLPPDIENKFLNYVESFEEAYDKAERITVYEFIGKPDYEKADLIPKEKIGHALENIMEILNNNEIALETLCDVDDRVLYSFITEELFNEEMDNMRIDGMVHHFIYEEFHPNHEYDIRNHSTDFIQIFLDKSSDYYTTFLTKEAEEDHELLQFRNSFGSFCLNHFNIDNLTFDEEKARVIFEADFSATIENTRETQHFKGKGTIELLYRYDFWCVHKVKFPPAL